jgi:maleylacetate reductase
MTPVFNYSNPPVIHWGAGSLERLDAELARLSARKVALITTRSVLANQAIFDNLRHAIGSAAAPVVVTIAQHAPIAEVDAAVERAAAAGVDGLVSFGGGSAIDAAKIVAVKVADRDGPSPKALPHVAIPTTLSVAELASGAGYTDPAGNKAGARDPRMLPDAVIYDAELTMATPLSLWLSTGIRALDHAVEGFLADGQHPFSDVMALEGVRRLFSSLPVAKSAPRDVDCRTENQLGAWFSYTLPGPTAGGLSHVMGKQIGARYGIPHGVTSCLLMPHVMRFVARTKPERMLQLARVTGAGMSPLDAADDVERLIASLGLPQHLAEFGLGEAQLRQAAEALAGTQTATELLGIYLSAL